MRGFALAPLLRAESDTVRHLDVRDEQIAFVAPIDQMLAEQTPGVDFHVVRAGREVVGFFKIDPPGVSTFPFVAAAEIGLRGLLIGAQYQGKGYGRALATALPGYLAQHYSAPRATLAVDHDNPVALHTYFSGGWVDSGDTVETGSGPAHILHLTLP